MSLDLCVWGHCIWMSTVTTSYVQHQDWRLIDWEYAGDGDIALELSAVWVNDDSQHQRLVSAYAQRAHIEQNALWRQVKRWRPWVIMLKAGWFEYRWRQTGDRQFIRLADETWRQLIMKG
ncbi:thiamine kinase [Citrobacter freundii]|nr:thiamine kinase [Citrobacter freundii]